MKQCAITVTRSLVLLAAVASAGPVAAQSGSIGYNFNGSNNSVSGPGRAPNVAVCLVPEEIRGCAVVRPRC